jgi:hypothetical protein
LTSTCRGNQLMDEIREEMRLSREQFAELRVFMRDITLRIERGGREQVRQLRELTESVRKDREENRAQTQALLRVIDRMDRLDPGGSAA